MKALKQSMVGVFTIGALLMFLVGVFYLGGRDLFQQDREYVVYFDESVNGLTVGAPVVLRGVPLGKVTRVSLVTNPKDSSVTIPVHFTIDRNRLVPFDHREIDEDLEHRMVRRMVDLGLRAHLVTRSIITGQLGIELDFEPNVPAHFQSGEPDIEIPSSPSSIEELQQLLANLPLENMAKSLNTILSGLADTLSGDDLKKGLAHFAATFEESARILKDKAWQGPALDVLENLDAASKALLTRLPETLESFNKAMNSLAMATTQANLLLDRNSPTVQDLRRLLKDGSDASRALRNLADMLERNPEALLKGKKGGR